MNIQAVSSRKSKNAFTSLVLYQKPCFHLHRSKFKSHGTALLWPMNFIALTFEKKYPNSHNNNPPDMLIRTKLNSPISRHLYIVCLLMAKCTKLSLDALLNLKFPCHKNYILWTLIDCKTNSYQFTMCVDFWRLYLKVMFERSKQISLHLTKILSCPQVCVYYVCALTRHTSEFGAFPAQLLQYCVCNSDVKGDCAIFPSTAATQTHASIHVCMYMYPLHCNFTLVYMFSTGYPHLSIQIHRRAASNYFPIVLLYKNCKLRCSIWQAPFDSVY